MTKTPLLAMGLLPLLLGACTPTVRVASDPIEINMNIKIEHEVRIKVDKELDKIFEDEDLF